jgi:hypothetical protein
MTFPRPARLCIPADGARSFTVIRSENDALPALPGQSRGSPQTMPLAVHKTAVSAKRPNVIETHRSPAGAPMPAETSLPATRSTRRQA